MRLRSVASARWMIACVGLWLVGCGTPVVSHPDTGPIDSTIAGDATGDAIADADAPLTCTTNPDCDDHLYCNGVEYCMPTATNADARGCVAGNPANPCMPTQTCDETQDRCVSNCGTDDDADHDMHRAVACGGDDCDDSDANIHPGATEICDAMNHDEDCDSSTFGFRDSDSDGYPDARCCNATSGSMMNCGDDCNDSRPNVHPALAEACDGLDNDCNGMIDESVSRTFYPDSDGDGFGDSAGTTMTGCVPPAGYVEPRGDCDDTDSAVHPGAPEVCDLAMRDENCDGTANPPTLCNCSGDVSRPCALPGTCAAGTERCVGGSWGACSIAPVAESCNGIDDDCDGSVDEMLTVACYADADNDGYATAGAAAVNSCPVTGRDGVGGCPTNQTNRAPSAPASIDCDDSNAGVSPGAAELCDAMSVDENCDGMANPSSVCACSGSSTRACSLPGACAAGTQTCSSGSWGACSIQPVAEVCNGIDDNCNGTTDEMLTVTCYADGDNDGYALMGAAATPQCPDMTRPALGNCPINYTNRAPVAGSIDCNGSSAAISPAAVELCDASMVDENCNGMVNEGCGCTGTATRACTLPGACAAGTQMCSSGAWGPCSIMPTTESCNGVDDDCDGMVDEMLTVVCFVDADNDTYAAAGAMMTQSCPVAGRMSVGGCPTNLTNRAPTAGSIDCADMVASRNPAAAEVCNGTDDDCDGMVDEGVTMMVYVDADRDGFGTGAPMMACSVTAGFANNNLDCDDANVSRNPSAVEVCNGVDDNCNGTLDGPGEDDDGDGHADDACAGTGGSDCDDSFAGTYNGAPEVCDRRDNNCSTAGSNGVDASEDGDSDMHSPVSATCTGGFPRDDCNDANATIYPGHAEICDGNDNDCNSMIDDGGAEASCAVPNAYSVCRAGACRTLGCAPGFGDCDSMRTTGCETNLLTTATACGACGRTCGTGGTCMQGRCDAVIQVAAGMDHACALRETGTVECWGANASGQLGDGTITPHTSAVVVTGITDAAQISAGAQHTCAVRRTGGVMCWGANTNGELGDGTTMMRTSPVAVSTLVDAVEVSTGGTVTCARRTSGAVSCWGSNASGQIGDGTTTMRLTPTAVSGLVDAAQISAGGSTVCARRTGGTGVCWGANAGRQIGDGTTTMRLVPTAVTGLTGLTDIRTVGGSGGDHSCASNATNTYCWGVNTSSQCGTGTGVTPMAINATAYPSSRVATGQFHSCLLRNGVVRCWGRGTSGQLGDSNGINSAAPVDTLLTDATQISAFGNFTCALQASGAISCWGDNANGQIGNNSTTNALSPTEPRNAYNVEVVQVATGDRHTCARRATGRIACWGLNASGQVGDGSTTNRTAPVNIASITDAVDVTAGGNHTCVQRSTGALVCWGANASGQLGDGTMTNRLVPTAVASIADGYAVTAGNAFTCVQRASGAVSCFGAGAAGQLGNGATASSTAPVTVTGLSDAIVVDAGNDFACARRRTGGVSCWGNGASGQLGTGMLTSSSTPVAVVGIDDAWSIGAGGAHACAGGPVSHIQCWGNNASGQLGDGTTTQHASPVATMSTVSPTVLRAGANHTSMTSSFSVSSWGGNIDGEIGDGTTTNRFTPTAATFPPRAYTFSDADDGERHTCGVGSTSFGSNTVFCWGRNTEGQLGDGTATSSNTPVSAFR